MDDGMTFFRYPLNRQHSFQVHWQTKESITMAAKIDKTKPKRLSKSERTHRRRLKQAVRMPGAGDS
jgi:hypothetical protein